MYRDDLDIPAGMDPHLAALVATWQDGTREWRESLGMPPQEAVIWQPYPDGPSIGGILLHVVSCTRYWLEEFIDKTPPDMEDLAVRYDRSIDQYVPQWLPPPNEPIEWYFDLQDRSRGRAIELIKRHGDPTAEYEGRGSISTYRWIVAHDVEHDSYHGGQCVMLHEMWKKRGA